jgi:hypothetical protein
MSPLVLDTTIGIIIPIVIYDINAISPNTI